MYEKFNIAMDGPAGAGKSSVADALAKHYGMIHLDTGAMYRAAALFLHEKGIEPKESSEMQKTLDTMQMHFDQGRLILNGEDVSEKIRQPEVSILASKYSAIPSLRKRLVALQQAIASRQGYIVDGRDICDVVLPDAAVKLYLDASPESRAERRLKQDEEKGIRQDFSSVLKDIQERDYRDMHRDESPLRISPSAHVIDSSDLSLAQTIEAIENLISRILQSDTRNTSR